MQKQSLYTKFGASHDHNDIDMGWIVPKTLFWLSFLNIKHIWIS